MAERREQRIRIGALACVLLVAIAVRVIYLGEPLSTDEALTFEHYSIHSFRFIATTYNLPNNQLLYTLLVHSVWLVIGDHVWTVRLPAFAAGVAIVPATYLAARELYSREAAIWASALAAAFGPLVGYSIIGRGYTLGILLVVLLVPLGAALLRGSSLRLWAAFVVCSALAVYTIPTMAYGVAAVMLWIAWVAILPPLRERELLAPLGLAVAAAAGVTVLLYAPVLGQRGWSADPTLALTYHNVHSVVGSVWVDWNAQAPHPFDWLILAGAATGLVLHRRVARHPVPVLFPAAVVLVVVFVFTPISPYVRTWLYLAPFYLITAGAGLAWAFTRGWIRLEAPGTVSSGLAIVVAAVLAFAVIHDGRSRLDQAPQTANDIVSFIRGHLTPGERVVFGDHVATASAYYFRVADYQPPLFAGIATGARNANLLVLMVGRPGPVAALRYAVHTSPTPVAGGSSTRLARLSFITAYRVQVHR